MSTHTGIISGFYIIVEDLTFQIHGYQRAYCRNTKCIREIDKIM